MKSLILNNGLKIFYEQIPHLHEISVDLFIRCGSRYESNDKLGATYLLNQINYLCGNSPKLLKAGNNMSVTTYKEYSRYSIYTLKENFRDSIDVMRNTAFECDSDKYFDEAKTVVLKNIAYNDENNFNGYFESIIFSGSGLSNPCCGEYNCVEAMSVNDAEQTRKKIFTGENMMLFISGNITDDDIEYAEKTFSVSPLEKNCLKRDDIKTSCGTKIITDDGSTTDVRMSFAIDYSEYSGKEMSVLSSILNNNDSLLNGMLYNRFGDSFGIYSDVTTFTDIALFNLYFKIENIGFRNIVNYILNNVYNISNGISEEYLRGCVEKFVHETVAMQDNPTAYNSEAAWSIMTGGSAKTCSASEFTRMYRAMSILRLKNLFEEMMNREKLFVLAVGSDN